MPSDSPKEVYEVYFVFACIWAFGGTLQQDQVFLEIGHSTSFIWQGVGWNIMWSLGFFKYYHKSVLFALFSPKPIHCLGELIEACGPNLGWQCWIHSLPLGLSSKAQGCIHPPASEQCQQSAVPRQGPGTVPETEPSIYPAPPQNLLFLFILSISQQYLHSSRLLWLKIWEASFFLISTSDGHQILSVKNTHQVCSPFSIPIALIQKWVIFRSFVCFSSDSHKKYRSLGA